MKRLLFLYLLVSFCFPLLAGNVRIPDSTLPPHPRLLLLNGEEQALMQYIGQDSVWNLFQQRTIEACDRLLTRTPLEKVKIGRRMLGTSREALYRIFMLSYAYRTTNNEKYAVRATEEMLHMARYDDWNPEHFLDVAEMTMAMSIGYDWLYPTLTPATEKEIASAILNKGLKPSLDKRYNSFLEKTNNWNQVCNTAMAYGAIALMEENKPLCREILERSVTEIQKPMHNYGPDGAYPEGYGYWHYGTTYNVMMLAALDALYGTDFGLSAIPGFIKGANYILHMVGPTGKPFNFGDSGGHMRLNTSLFWFARRTNDPSLLRYERRQLLETKNYDYEEYRRMLPSIFILGKGLKMDKLPVPKETFFAAHNEAPVCLMRTSWQSKDAIYVAIKGGSASANTHTHLDAGSFVMDALGVRWAVDLGPQDYNSLESKGIDLWDNSPHGKRWTVYRYNNFAHNVFSINNELFHTEGRGNLIDYTDAPGHTDATFDLTSLYTGLDKAERRISLDSKKGVAIEDRIVNGSTKACLTWRMLTPADVEPVNNGFILRKKGKTVRVELPEGITSFSRDASPQTDYDEENPEITIIGYTTEIAPHNSATLKVTLLPEQDSILTIGNKVAQWQIDHQAGVVHHDLDWTNGAWYRGLAQWAKVTDNDTYFNFLKQQGEKNNWNVYYRLHHADDICVAQTYLELANKYGDKRMLQPTIARADSVLKFPSPAPLMKTDSLGRNERWSWADALFMAPPVYASLSKLTGNREYIDFMQKEFEECTDSLYDATYKLYYRDCSKKALREPNGTRQFWARGNGWVFAGIPLIIENLPEGYAKRDYFIELFKEMAASVINTQDEKGSWHASLLDPATYPQPENSASGFFCYGLAWGINNGILDPAIYKEPTVRAWQALCSYVNAEGKLGYIQPVGNAPKQVNKDSTDVYGVGAFLLAASEMLRLP